MSKHTPGPWVVYDDSNDGKTNRIEIAARGKTVTRIYNSVLAEDLPNACLIASAPELLEFAQWVLSLKTGGMIEARARAVVAKAGGSA